MISEFNLHLYHTFAENSLLKNKLFRTLSFLVFFLYNKEYILSSLNPIAKRRKL